MSPLGRDEGNCEVCVCVSSFRKHREKSDVCRATDGFEKTVTVTDEKHIWLATSSSAWRPGKHPESARLTEQTNYNYDDQ